MGSAGYKLILIVLCWRNPHAKRLWFILQPVHINPGNWNEITGSTLVFQQKQISYANGHVALENKLHKESQILVQI